MGDALFFAYAVGKNCIKNHSVFHSAEFKCPVRVFISSGMIKVTDLPGSSLGTKKIIMEAKMYVQIVEWLSWIPTQSHRL